VLRAKTFERQIIELEVVGIYRPLDIALLKPQDPDALKRSRVACYSTASLRPGKWVAAVGHPYSMPYSLSTGAISALERGEILSEWTRSFPGFIQSDLTLNPGNSGGPLIDQRGVMLGLNTAIHGSGVGMFFVLPFFSTFTRN
jgi:S1-C subfamily serine protease